MGACLCYGYIRERGGQLVGIHRHRANDSQCSSLRQARAGRHCDALVRENISLKRGSDAKGRGTAHLEINIVGLGTVDELNRGVGRGNQSRADLDIEARVGVASGVESEGSRHRGRAAEMIDPWQERAPAKALTSQVVGGKEGFTRENSVGRGKIAVGLRRQRVADMKCSVRDDSWGKSRDGVARADTHIPTDLSRPRIGHRRRAENREGIRRAQDAGHQNSFLAVFQRLSGQPISSPTSSLRVHGS